MSHTASERSCKYLEKYMRGSGVPLHNKTFGELSDELAQKVDILQPLLQNLPMMWAC